jgi:hypothetical protein
MCTATAKQAALKTWDEQDQMVPASGSNADSTAGGALCPSRGSPCVFNVVTDVTESENLFDNPNYNATVALLLARVDYHLGRYANFSIDHSKHTAESYCEAVKEQQWVQPFEDFVPSPSPSPPPHPPTPPQPVPSTPQAELVGTWEATNGEQFTVEIDPMHSGNSVYGLFVKTAGNLTLCWSPMLPGLAFISDNKGGMELDVGGPAPKCSGGKRSMVGKLVWDPLIGDVGHRSQWGNAGHQVAPIISWKDGTTGKPGWKSWSKVI